MPILYPTLARLRRLLRRWQRELVQPALGAAEIAGALAKLQPRPERLLMVHSSLSACGKIRGGASTVIGALRAWVGGGTLVLPTHTYCYPDASGIAPVYDAQSTCSLVGKITNEFWRQAGVVRSIHPTHSLAACGPEAEAICTGHEQCETPCGKGTPYERLLQQNCAVLMFGVTLNTYTFFHTAEDAAGLSYLYEESPYTLRYKDRAGQACTLKMWRQNMRIPRRFAEMDGWLEARNLLVRQKLGLGELLYLPQAGTAHRALVEEMKRNPCLLVDQPARPH